MRRIRHTLLSVIALAAMSPAALSAQDTYTANDTIYNPKIVFTASPTQYQIAGIRVEGVDNYDDNIIIGYSGLAVGQHVDIPGDDLKAAAKRFWRQGLFSKVQILVEKIYQDQAWLVFNLRQQPRVSQVNYNGMKSGEKKDIIERLSFQPGSQMTPNIADRIKLLVEKYYANKGFGQATCEVVQVPDLSKQNEVIVNINVDKHEKIKVHKIYIDGNEVLSDTKIKRTMKKTNEKNKILNTFKAKKFIQEKYEEDKGFIIDKYNEYGYRDAQIVTDSVKQYDDRSVDIFIKIDEGQKYFVRNIDWVGNTVYPTNYLSQKLRMKRGDVYNQKLLNERLSKDEDAIGNDYYNNGYVFYSLDPVEINVDNDSIDLEMRIVEGPQATINRVKITGNDRLYEHVVRRELRTKPGDLFSKEALERSYREIAQMGHFNPENINPDVKPDPTNGTVDINYILESKANDQIELSAGWGQTGIIGKVSLKLTNFAIQELFSKTKNRRGIVPQGEGQTLTLSGQTNGTYYQSYSVSFLDPWFGGKRPTSFSVTAFYSKQTDVSSNYYSSYNNYYSYYYGNYNSSAYNSYENYYDPDKYVQLFGVTLGFGKRLRWPDDYFTLSAALTYQRYMLKNWAYFLISDGNCNNINLELSLNRNSTDNQIYPRRGSEFSLSAALTPPFSLWDGKDYEKLSSVKSTENKELYLANMQEKFNWIEYHKWKFKLRSFTALANGAKCPVLMTRVEFGLLGHYNKYKKSPFETFYVGGDGMTGYSSSYATETIGLRGYENGSLTPTGSEGYAYSRLGLELRYPLMLETSTSIYCLAFAEGGNAWTTINKFNPFDMKRSAGVGVRIFLPMIGMMGIDWAYGFDKVYGTKGGSQFHFIIGQEF